MNLTSFLGSVLFLLQFLTVPGYPRYDDGQIQHHQSVRVSTCAEGNLDLLRNRIRIYPPGSQRHIEAKEELDDALATIDRETRNFARIETILLNNKSSSQVLPVKYTFNSCHKSLRKIYNKYCGVVSIYGLKYAQDIDKMCDAGVTESQMTEAAIQACSTSN